MSYPHPCLLAPDPEVKSECTKCYLAAADTHLFFPELAGPHQEESTHWLPQGGGNLAQEQCPDPGNDS